MSKLVSVLVVLATVATLSSAASIPEPSGENEVILVISAGENATKQEEKSADGVDKEHQVVEEAIDEKEVAKNGDEANKASPANTHPWLISSLQHVTSSLKLLTNMLMGQKQEESTELAGHNSSQICESPKEPELHLELKPTEGYEETGKPNAGTTSLAGLTVDETTPSFAEKSDQIPPAKSAPNDELDDVAHDILAKEPTKEPKTAFTTKKPQDKSELDEEKDVDEDEDDAESDEETKIATLPERK